MDIKDKAVLITGAAIRIGRSLSLALAEKGAKIGVHYHHSKPQAVALVRAIEQNGGTAALIKGDMAYADQCARMVEEAVHQLGALHVLVNNAAVFIKTPLFQTTEKEWDQILDINLKGAFFCAQAAAGAMTHQDGAGGKIIHIADWSAFRPYRNYLPYCISKAGVIALTQGLARTLAPKITVNAIALGAMLLPEGFDEDQKRTIVQKTPMQRIGSPDDVVRAVLFLLEGSDFTTGSTLLLDGGRLIAGSDDYDYV